jgi:hypothetical protein
MSIQAQDEERLLGLLCTTRDASIDVDFDLLEQIRAFQMGSR